MKKYIIFLLAGQLMFSVSGELFSQSTVDMQEFGITTGGFSNFPANQHYLTDYMSAIYLAPYIRTGKHEFSAGILYPLKTQALNFNDNKINPCIGAIASYKFYVFNVYGRENMFIHYSFEYMRYKGSYDTYNGDNKEPYHWTEKDMYINNVIGLGYNLFFDINGRFGFYYILDYVISQSGYKLSNQDVTDNSWTTNYIWNNLSNQVGFLFKLTSLKKKIQ
jgi:hypothetical protein